ncbi:MAG: ArgE/DapE family deacylase [Chloroflexi bacterium]|nr:ArgE/DapE family deacylase [Chloroflexota bacterium]
MPDPDAALVATIRGAIEARRDATVGLLQALVRVPSVTGDEGAVQDVVEAALRARGLTIDRWEATPEEMAPYLGVVGQQRVWDGRPNLAGVRAGAGGGRSILLNAHVDTVDPGDPAAWSHPPLSATLAGDRLYGRGACDMKGGLVSYLAALDALDAVGIQLAGEVRLVATVGEEDGGLGALSAVLRGHRADAALITEPTRLAVVTAQGGSAVFRLTVPGRAAHAAMRDEGVSALEKFLPLLAALQDLERERNATLDHPLYAGMTNKVPVNIGVVRTGNWASTVPESLVAEGRVGLAPGEDIDAFRALVTERIMATAARDPWLRDHPPALVWFGGQFAPAETPADAPLVTALRQAHARVTGQPPPIEAVTYGADMRLFIEYGGMPCVMYGAGDIRVAHAPDEWLAIDDLLTAATTLAVFLVEWCGRAG